MNMQISPGNHSRKLRDPHVDVIGYKVVCDVRNTSNFKTCFWDCI